MAAPAHPQQHEQQSSQEGQGFEVQRQLHPGEICKNLRFLLNHLQHMSLHAPRLVCWLVSEQPGRVGLPIWDVTK